MPRRAAARTAEPMFARLLAHYGPQRWWPAETDLEVVVGAMLVQNTAWRNAARAIAALRAADVLDVHRLHALGDDELAGLIRSCGYYRIKARRLKNLLAMIVDQHAGQLPRLWQLPIDQLRQALLGVNGVGPETADSIVLYAAGKPSFVIDKYTWRVLARHGWIDPRAGYAEMQAWFERQLPPDVALFNEFHALLVRVGHEQCRAVARCEGCPLAGMLPRGGPVTC